MSNKAKKLGIFSRFFASKAGHRRKESAIVSLPLCVCVCVCDGKVEFGFATCVQIQSDNQGAHQTLPKAEDQWEKLELSFIN